MNSMQDYSAALAAMLIDDELRWRLDRLPRESDFSVLDRAILREAALRGIGSIHTGGPVSAGQLAAVPAEPDGSVPAGDRSPDPSQSYPARRASAASNKVIWSAWAFLKAGRPVTRAT